MRLVCATIGTAPGIAARRPVIMGEHLCGQDVWIARAKHTVMGCDPCYLLDRRARTEQIARQSHRAAECWIDEDEPPPVVIDGQAARHSLHDRSQVDPSRHSLNQAGRPLRNRAWRGAQRGPPSEPAQPWLDALCQA